MTAAPFVVLGERPRVHPVVPAVAASIEYRVLSNVALCAEPPAAMVPAGPYDLEATMRRPGITDSPDLIAAYASAAQVAPPVNLGAFRCPKLLLCADTHQFPARSGEPWRRRAGRVVLVDFALPPPP
jgi:hypothetical protein